jgi:hypothetical protein
MGLAGISKSQVSKLCKDIDERVNAFLERPIDGEWPYLWLDATYLKVGDGGRIVELLRNVGDGRGQAASGCWLTASMPSMNFTPVISFGNWLWPSTADCEEQPLPPYHGSVLALDADTGRLWWVFRPREADPNKCDFDFGASPNLIAVAEKRYVGIGGKDGTYYLLDRLTGRPRWTTRVVFGGGAGGFFGGAAFDGLHVFSATAFGDGNVNTQTGLCDPVP